MLQVFYRLEINGELIPQSVWEATITPPPDE